jgi:acyl-coenzyme A thioesterase PaaI-like protein
MAGGASDSPGPGTDLEALADAVRRLLDVTVSAAAPGNALAAARDGVLAAVAALEPFVPQPKPPRYPSPPSEAAPNDFFPYDFVLGRFNPIAVPLKIVWQDPLAIGTVVFDTPYEGPPGCVHGGVLAACFDQVFNAANLMSGVAGPTRRLEIRYLKPTPLRRELRFEGSVRAVEGREVHSVGRVLAGDVVTVEATGQFVQISPERVMRLLGAKDEAGPKRGE